VGGLDGSLVFMQSLHRGPGKMNIFMVGKIIISIFWALIVNLFGIIVETWSQVI